MRACTSSVRRAVILPAIGILALLLAGCQPGAHKPGAHRHSGNKLDGVYHLGAIGSSTVLTIKNNKAILNIGGEAKALNYKVEGGKLTILDPQDGQNLVLTINDDGTLTSPGGTFVKAK